MFQRQATAGSTNTVIEYGGEDWINFTNDSPGATYNLFGTDVTSGVTLISTERFQDTQQVTCDDTQYIVDDVLNVYYRVISYRSESPARPPRI